MEIHGQRILQYTFLDDEIGVWLNVVGKMQKEASKAGFKKMFTSEEIELLKHIGDNEENRKVRNTTPSSK